LTELKRRLLFEKEDILKVTDAKCLNYSGKASSICSVVIDSRKATPSSLFIPLKGTKTDGHRFLDDAVKRGATAVFIAKTEWEKQADYVHKIIESSTVDIYMVEDTLKALQVLAKFYLNTFKSLYRIGITGSNGKTTTKEIIGSILKGSADTIINEGNLNSEIGLPLSVFQVQPHHKYAVFEMGINHEGEMDILSEIVKADSALITNIGIAHIGILGSINAIAEEKKKIFKFFNGNQNAFIYEKDAFYSFLSKDIKGRVIPFGPEKTIGVKGYRDLGLDGAVIYWEEFQVRYPLMGYYNFLNALCAISLACELGIEADYIKEGLENVKPLFGRSQIIRDNVTIIQDCYNSNPNSALETLKFFHAVPWKGKKVAILGSMLELGENSEENHKMVVDLAVSLNFDFVFLYGNEFEGAYRSIKEKHCMGFIYWTESFDSLRLEIEGHVKQGDLIFLKGSRGMQLELLVPFLQNMIR